jgi:hypothetical protein
MLSVYRCFKTKGPQIEKSFLKVSPCLSMLKILFQVLEEVCWLILYIKGDNYNNIVWYNIIKYYVSFK